MMTSRLFLLLVSLAVAQCLTPAVAWAQVPPAGGDPYGQCLLQAMERLGDAATVAQVRAACATLRPVPAPPPASALEARLRQERQAQQRLFTILPHRPNYLLVASYNDHPSGRGLGLDDSSVDPVEMKFQLSFKTLLAKDLLGADNGFLYGAYTMRSFWQAYNDNISSPFRETNHEPELFLAWRTPGWSVAGWSNTHVLAGFNHQSNGRSGAYSRSWNRLFTEFLFARGDSAASLKAWYRIPEEERLDPREARGDDNPDISRYLGYGELTVARRLGGHTVSVMLRNNLRRHGNRGYVEASWSFPLWGTTPLKGYLQYANGYGESLIDYDTAVHRLGLGVVLGDWL